MLRKSRANFNRIRLLLCLAGATALVVAIIVSATRADAQTVKPDRISFYNVPIDEKLESHVDYADGRTEKIKYPAALCAAGTVITQPLTTYTVTFVAEGCEPTVYQQLNLRWLGVCLFKFEYDPNARLIARGPYGEIVIGEGHYPAGELELTNLPATTTHLSVTMSYTDAQGKMLSGNVEFAFHEPHPGCDQAPLPTMTPTATSTTTPVITPIITPTTTAPTPVDSSPTPTLTPTAPTPGTPTVTPTTSTTTPVVTPMVTPTPTQLAPIDSSPTPTHTPIAPTPSTPTVTPTATQAVVLPPTGLDPVDEPGVALPWTVYLPFTTKSAGGS